MQLLQATLSRNGPSTFSAGGCGSYKLICIRLVSRSKNICIYIYMFPLQILSCYIFLIYRIYSIGTPRLLLIFESGEARRLFEGGYYSSAAFIMYVQCTGNLPE